MFWWFLLPSFWIACFTDWLEVSGCWFGAKSLGFVALRLSDVGFRIYA